MDAVQSAFAAKTPTATLFEYSGRLSESVVMATSQTLRSRLSFAGGCATRARKIFSSYVELAYNILHYAHGDNESDTSSVRCGSLRVTSHGAEYAITSRNRISHATAGLLTARLEQLRSMSTEQIRFEYRLRLTNLQFETADNSSKGASLGLLTVARNAVRPLEYSVYWSDADHQACSICIHTII